VSEPRDGTMDGTTYYRATATPYEPFAPLAGTHDAAIVVVGGGFAGLATALGLAERGVRDVMLLEAEQVAYGASGRNGGFVFGGYSLGEEELVRELGREAAMRVYRRTVDAVELIRRRIARYAIPCDPVDEGVVWANWFRDDAVLRARQRVLREELGVEWEWIPATRMRELLGTARYDAGLWERNALHVHPLNYAIGVAQAAAGQGVRIHEHSRATRLEKDGSGWRVSTARGTVRAPRVVLACGGYLAGLDARFDRAILPIATYAMATERLGPRIHEIFKGTRAAIYDTRFAFDYYRPLPDTRMLWGGRISILERSPASVARLLQRDVAKVFPDFADVRIDYAWNGLMGYPRQKMPQLREVEPGLWSAQGFGGHGFATTTAGGEVVAAALAEGDTAWKDYARYDLVSTFKPFGMLGAQAEYWRLELLDALKDLRHGAA
jgi:gamma-glutamylputrescine oxidase